MKLKSWQLSATIICIITGIFISFNLKAQSDISTTSGKNTVNLADMIAKIEEENAVLEQDIAALRKNLDVAQKNQTTAGSLQGLRQQLDKAKMLSGLSSLEGPGVTVTLNDRTTSLEQARKAGGEVNYWDFLVHDSDLVNLINDLKAGGAEAISINGQRMVTTSDIKCGGYIVYSNGTRLGAPYMISAIGNPKTLELATKQGTTFSTLNFMEYPITITKMDKIVIPAYKGSLNLNFAKVIH